MGQNEVKPPDPNQPPAPNPPMTGVTNNALAKGQSSVQVTGTGMSGQDPTVGVTVSGGLPAFSESHSQQINLMAGSGGVGLQHQNTLTLHQGPTSQQTLTTSATLQMNPKLAAGLGINAEQDWGGDHPQRPRYQMVEQVYGSSDQNAQIGNTKGTGKTLGGSVDGLYNWGLSQDLNPKYTLGIEVKAQNTEIDAGHVNQFLATGGAVGAVNFTMDKGRVVASVGANVYGGVQTDGHGGAHPVYGGGLTVGVAFGGQEHHAPPPKEERVAPTPIIETKVSGIVSDVDPEHDKVSFDIGGGRTQDFKLSRLRNDAEDKQAFDKQMQRGERLDVTTRPSGSHISADYGRDYEWLKNDLASKAKVASNGDLTIGNATIKKELGDLYRPWLEKPTGLSEVGAPGVIKETPQEMVERTKREGAERDLIDTLDKQANNKKEAIVLGRDDKEPPDFSRGSQHLPKLAVHMAPNGKGAEHGAGIAVKGATFTGLEDKDGVTTVNYTVAGRKLAMSFPDKVGGFGNDPSNPYNNATIDAAIGGHPKDAYSKELVSAGAKNLVRGLDTADGGTAPLQSPNGTTARDLLKRTTFDEKTNDVSIGNLKLKGDCAAFYMQAINAKPPDHELIARVERLADGKQPTTIDLAMTKDAALKERDQRGFGEPANPVRTAFDNLKPNDKFEFTIDPKNDAAKLVNKTQGVETPLHSYGVDPQQPSPPERARGRELVHERH